MKCLFATLLIPALLATVAPFEADATENTKPRGVRFDPVIRDLEGWTVHVEPALLKGPHADEGTRALRMLGDHLNRISILVPPDQLAAMRTLEIWIEHDHPTLKAMQYHPGEIWLRGNGHDPRLHKKVHIPVASALLSRGQLLKHPAVILHELSHAYHDQILSFDHPGIIEAYKNAAAGGAYEDVLLYTGKRTRHYALTNHKEYFAEATEAWFYRNDFYPFVRAELKAHDPGVYDLLAEIWSDKKGTR